MIYGICASRKEARRDVEMYTESGSVERAFADAVAYNFEKIRTLSVKTPDEKINHIMNNWVKSRRISALSGKRESGTTCRLPWRCLGIGRRKPGRRSLSV